MLKVEHWWLYIDILDPFLSIEPIPALPHALQKLNLNFKVNENCLWKFKMRNLKGMEIIQREKNVKSDIKSGH